MKTANIKFVLVVISRLNSKEVVPVKDPLSCDFFNFVIKIITARYFLIIWATIIIQTVNLQNSYAKEFRI